MITTTAAAIQMHLRRSFEENLAEAEALIQDAVERGARILCLPEYFSMPQEFISSFDSMTAMCSESIAFLKKQSHDHRCLIAGSILEPRDGEFYNVCHIYENGQQIGAQPKVHLVEMEERLGLRHADGFSTFSSSYGTVGALVCADVQYPEACRVLGLKSADIVFNPVVSFYREQDETKEARDCLFISRAYDNDYFLIKAGGYGVSPNGMKLAGRSRIAAPWGMLARASGEKTSEAVIADLDFALLEKLRNENYSLRRRISAAYAPLLE